MRIAFYAPLKAPDHPTPSGDRLMARLLSATLTRAGHRVELVSRLRPFLRSPEDRLLARFQAEAEAERARIAESWRKGGAPDLWFTYHPYYKAPDLLGPPLARAFGLPYVTAESSWSRRRTAGDWGVSQRLVREGLSQAAMNLCLTARDRAGILATLPRARTLALPPFIDPAPFAALPPAPEPGHLVTVAMMRPGDKLSSFRALAAALALLPRPDWRLTIAGDGTEAATVRALFARFGERVAFPGALPREEVASLLSTGALYVWPGHGEAYGLAYLEAEAAGLPVIAEATAGVPEVVVPRHGGVLVPPGDPAAFADAIAALLDAPPARAELARQARSFVLKDRSIDRAAEILGDLLARLKQEASCPSKR